ncbi:hypothetical protein [Coleofasciculus sp. G2-EDA-02]|uniref:hypothetical protein n=1 Tax=Coleofasciculus sp. G2-EDA-02 TaxID=3069529 RepID=UPI0032F2F235
MSASTPGRYRSRLFNLINHHSRRLIDRGERAIRHLKVAAVWGTQILLYPIYMVVQTSLTAVRQLSAEAKAGWTRLKALTQSQPLEQPPAVDTPIQQVLKEAETLSLPEPSQWKRLQPVGDQERQIVGAGLTDNVTQETDNLTKPALLGKEKGKTTFSTGRLKPQLHKQNLPTQVSQSSRVEIQGVASLLSTRTLVLVSVANEILDILTPEQQQKLAAKISWELANLYRQWRLVYNLKTSGVQRQLSHLAKPSLFLPLRLFWQLMAWVQTSPVAIAINLFGESTFSEPASGAKIPQNLAYSWLKQFAPGGTLAAIDDTIAQWESHPKKTSNHVAIALRQRSQTLLQTFKTSFITYREPANPTETSESHPFWLVGLIYAAIDYFFGQGSSSRFRQQEPTSINPTEDINQRFTNSTASVTLPGTAFSYTNEPDPWLTWDDLFGDPEPTSTPNPFVTDSIWLKGKPQPNPTPLPPGFTIKKTAIWQNSIGAILQRLSFSKKPIKLTVTDRKLQRQTVNPTSPLFYPVPLQNSLITGLSNNSQNRVFVKVSPATFLEQTPTNSPTLLTHSTSLTRNTQNIPEKPIHHSSTSDIEPAPDWIETQAIPTGYVKHPLEQIMEWLDVGMLWLEEVTIKAWRWVRRFVVKNKG